MDEYDVIFDDYLDDFEDDYPREGDDYDWTY